MTQTMFFILVILSLYVAKCVTAPISNGLVSYVNLSHDPELGPVAEFGWEQSDTTNSGLPLSFVGTLAYLVYRAPVSKCRGYDFSMNHPLVAHCSFCHESEATMLAGKVIVSKEGEPVTPLPSIRINLCEQNPQKTTMFSNSNEQGKEHVAHSEQASPQNPISVPMKVSDASYYYIFYRCESSNVVNNGTERLKCENFVREKCVQVNSLLDLGCLPKSGPMTVQPSRTVKYDNSASGGAGGDTADIVSPGMDDNESQPFMPLDRAPYTHGGKYGMEPVRVSLFRYSLLLLLLTLFGYAGCRWYSRSVQFRTVRRTNGGVFAAADGATGLSVLSRTLTGAGASRSTGGLLSTSPRSAATASLSNNRTNTRLLLFNRYSSAAAGSSGRGRVYGLRTAASSGGGVGESNLGRDADGMGQGGEIDEAIEACVRVLMRSDPNFAVQFAKNYRTNNTDANAATQHQANSIDLEPTLPSYQEAVAQNSTSTSVAAARPPADDDDDTDDFPPPPSPPVLPESVDDLSGEVGLDGDSQSLSGLPPPYPSEGGEGEVEEDEEEFSMSEGTVENGQWVTNDVTDSVIIPTSDVDGDVIHGFMNGQNGNRDSPT